MRPRFPILLVCLLLWCCHLAGQPSSGSGTPCVKGYNVTLTGLPATEAGHQLYLYGFDGIEVLCLDSATISKGRLRFKNRKQSIPQGIYVIGGAGGGNVADTDCCECNLTSIVIHQDNRFTLDMAGGSSNSEENQMWATYLRLLAGAQSAEQARTASDQFLSASPNAFVSKYIRVTTAVGGRPVRNEKDYQACLEAVDFADPRLLHVPPFYLNGLYTYILEPESQSSADCIAKADALLSRCTNPAVRNRHLRTLFALLDVHNPDYDPVLVHLYDHYDRSWIDEGDARRYKRKTDNLRKIIPGAEIPELISHDIDGKAHSTLDIKARYTLLWFWDPDCDHCQEMTPPLHQFYQEHSRDYGFEVFAVEVNDDFERWKAFSDKHGLWDWTNLSTSRGEANLDFIEYFDIMTTPVMFLIDNSRNHTIIARQITLDELRSFLKKQTTHHNEK